MGDHNCGNGGARCSPRFRPIAITWQNHGRRGVFLRRSVVITSSVIGRPVLRAARVDASWRWKRPPALIDDRRFCERFPTRVDHHARRDDRRPAVRRRGDRASAARTVEARDRDVPVDLHRARGGVRGVGVVLPRQPVRSGVLRRLAHRVQPVGRQPVHLLDHHGQLQRAEEVSAAGAAGRHHPGADLPRHLHRAGRGGDQPVLLGLLRIRRVPGLHRDHPGPRHRPRRRRRELRGAVRAQAPEPHRQVGRPQAVDQGERQAADDADVPRHRRARHHRSALRAGLHSRRSTA